jgi:hypothetical protein
MAATSRAIFVFKVEGLVHTECVVVSEYIVRARHNTTGASSTQAVCYYLVPKVGPVGFVRALFGPT